MSRRLRNIVDESRHQATFTRGLTIQAHIQLNEKLSRINRRALTDLQRSDVVRELRELRNEAAHESDFSSTPSEIRSLFARVSEIVADYHKNNTFSVRGVKSLRALRRHDLDDATAFCRGKFIEAAVEIADMLTDGVVGADSYRQSLESKVKELDDAMGFSDPGLIADLEALANDRHSAAHDFIFDDDLDTDWFEELKVDLEETIDYLY